MKTTSVFRMEDYALCNDEQLSNSLSHDHCHFNHEMRSVMPEINQNKLCHPVMAKCLNKLEIEGTLSNIILCPVFYLHY